MPEGTCVEATTTAAWWTGCAVWQTHRIFAAWLCVFFVDGHVHVHVHVYVYVYVYVHVYVHVYVYVFGHA